MRPFSSSLRWWFAHHHRFACCCRIVAVLLWTIIVLAIAVHFNGILTTNDLSECLTLGSGVYTQNVKLTRPFSTIHSFRYLCLRRDHCPAPRLVRALSYQIFVTAGILNWPLDCSSASRKPTPFRQELNLGASALTVSFG